jgi:uncharacterized protein YuzE
MAQATGERAPETTPMRLKYDEEANALYVYILDDVKPTHGEQIDAGTIVDLDDDGRVVGIEILNPARPWPVDEIAERFDLGMAETLLLRSISRENEPFPFGVRTEAAATLTRVGFN